MRCPHLTYLVDIESNNLIKIMQWESKINQVTRKKNNTLYN